MRLVAASILTLAILTSARAQVDVSFDAATGQYRISDKGAGFRLAGSIGQTPTGLQNLRGHSGARELRFRWNPGVPVEGSIKWIEGESTVWFALRYLDKTQGSGVAFPQFTSVPTGLNPFSYRDTNFAPAAFALNETSTPWLFFDDSARSFIISPAANFLVAKMRGDGKASIAVGLNDRLLSVPQGFVQESLLSFGEGINRTWDEWGTALRNQYRRRLPEPTADKLLEKFGYWTDNGADYYYNYDLTRGYANTLLDLKHRYDAEGIPLGYLQLDSWWYQKTVDDADGHPGAATKNSHLPAGSWNRYGGLYLYQAHPDLFPNGLADFDQKLGLPLATHNRWIDRNSPYHQNYKISGVAAIDPKWWSDVAEYLKSSGVVCYEQDWLDHIYQFSPEMSSKVGVADAFADGMANGCRANGLTMQYCMATPRFFLQGVKYPNLTTIRTSGDRFERGKWPDFLYASELAQEVGILPWCDVFKSGELSNLILSVLSAGPVGTGDKIGDENKDNILRAIREDGVLLKPDRPLVPTDQTYLDQAAGRPTPFLASTYTSQGDLKTEYLFAFKRPNGSSTATFKLRDFGLTARSYLLDLQTQQGKFVDPNEQIQEELQPHGYRYWMLAPISKSGIVLLGDLSRIVPTAHQRIQSIEDHPHGLTIHLSRSLTEKSIQIEAISPTKPTITGQATLQTWTPTTGRFTIQATGESFTILVKQSPPNHNEG